MNQNMPPREFEWLRRSRAMDPHAALNRVLLCMACAISLATLAATIVKVIYG